MKLKTSFFNPTVLKKDLTRFSPLWGLFLVFKLLAVLLSSGDPGYTAGTMAESMQALGIAQLFYGGICALLLFGNLFDTRTAYTLHALPMRREGWFFTHLCSGILFYLIPSVAEALILLPALQEFWYLALLRLAVGFVMFLFFFGIGAFSCMCAGTRLGALAVYALTNFLSLVVLYLFWSFYASLLPGVILDYQMAMYLCPVAAFSHGKFVLVDSRYLDYSFSEARGTWVAEFQGFIGNDWLQLLFAGLIAVAFWAVTLLLYRRRRIESAGDFISAKFMAPIFLFFYTFLFGATLYLMGDKSYIFLLIGLAIGFFTGLMLLLKKVNVFRKKAWLALGILSVVFSATLIVTALDPFGVVTYVPKPQQVQSATISQGYSGGVFWEDYTLQAVTLETQEELEMLEQLHNTFISEAESEGSQVTTGELTISYKLKDGRRVDRRYDIPRYSEAPEQIRLLLSRMDMFEDTDFLKNVVSLYYSDATDVIGLPGELPRVQIANPSRYGKDFHFSSLLTVQHTVTGSMDQDAMASGLWAAIWQDCLAGNTAQDWDYHSQLEGELEIEYLNEDGEIETEYFSVYKECTHTIEYLRSLAP